MDEVKVRRWERALDVPLTLSTVVFLAAYAWPILQPGLPRPSPGSPGSPASPEPPAR